MGISKFGELLSKEKLICRPFTNMLVVYDDYFVCH